MKLKRTILALALLAAWLPQAAAQSYQERARELSTLYRGRLQNSYHYRYNGTFYMFTRSFTPETLLYNGKLYQDVLLNVDAYSMDLVSKPAQETSGVVLDRAQVAWFTLDGRRFINPRYLGYAEAPEAYLEVVRDGREPLLRLNQKKFDTDHRNVRSETPEMDGNFDPEVINYFHRIESWYVIREGQILKISARKARRILKEAPAPGDVSPIPDMQSVFWHPNAELTEGSVTPLQSKPKGIGLPEGYFSEERPDTLTDDIYVTTALTATYRNKIYVIGEEGKAKGGKAFVSGTIFEAESGLPLPGAVIFDENTATYARSDRDGRYRIQLPTGDNLLNFNAESKEDLSLKVNVLADGTLDIVMTERINLLKGALISASSMEKHRTTAMGIESVSMQTIGKIPSAFGEGDIIKAVMTLPGVKSVGEASGGFNVRGGSADQNLVLFNENTIYNPTHLFGMFSAFNPDLVDEVELYKSSIPAEYGGRISSVLSVKTKEGDLNKIKGSLGLGLLTSRMHLEGPLVKRKTTFIGTFRTTYSDWLLKLLPKQSAYAGGGASFTDGNLGITHRFDDRHSLQAFGYYATDRFSFSGDTTFRYRNLNASLTYRYKTDERQSRISAGYDQYANTVQAHDWKDGAYDLQTFIRQAFIKATDAWKLGQHQFSYGLHLLGYGLEPGILNPFGEDSRIASARLQREWGLEPSLFAADTWQITETFSAEAGVRLSSFLALKPRKFYMGPEVRLSAKYSPAANFSLKAGFNTMQQYIHLISNTAAVSPMDTWRLSSADIAPTTGWQGAGGVYWTILGAGLDLSLEGYYKQTRNALDYKSGAMLSMNPRLAESLVPVHGRAYGVELMLKKPAGRLTGWISYSYSRSQLQEMQDRGAETINHGAWYNAPHDKPHEFKLVGNFALTHRFSFSVNVDYSTGRPVTIPVGRYWYDGDMRLAYSERNGYRIPDYFRVDAAFNIDPGHYLKALAHASITIGVYNVTGRKNPYSVFFKTTPDGTVHGYMLSVFATQIPYINLNILF